MDQIFPALPVFLKEEASNHKIRLITFSDVSHFEQSWINSGLFSLSFSLKKIILFYLIISWLNILAIFIKIKSVANIILMNTHIDALQCIFHPFLFI